MKNLIISINDLGYFRLLLDLALVKDGPDQLEIDSDDESAIETDDNNFNDNFLYGII